MANVAPSSLAHQLGSLFEGGSAAGLTDRQLLERFTTARDESGEAAFAALVTRHGPMVLGVCRQHLGDHQHAEDAFQAVFLVLARKARALREPDLLGNWLYGVALRTARTARCRLARRRRTEEEGVAGRPESRPAVQAERLIEREQAEALHREIDRLPGAFRVPVVLCYFEGLSPDEAAERLRWPSGTLRSRLVRAREKLRRGLLRRGVVLSGTGLAALLAPRSASASVSSLLCDSTTRAAIAFAARHAAGGALAAPAAALAQEVIRTMLWQKLKATALSLLLLATLATGAGYLSHSPATARAEPHQASAARPSTVMAKPDDIPRPSPGRMFVVGRVLDPDGKPAAGVPVDIIGTSRTPAADTDVDPQAFVVLGRGSTGGDGRFRIEASRASSIRFFDVYALAGSAGPGSGFGSVKLHPDAGQPVAEVHLLPEQVIRGKLVDVRGQPAAGVEVQLGSIYGEPPELDGRRFDSPRPILVFDGSAAPGGLRAWPQAVATDAQGRFTFTGVGRGLHVFLSVRDPRFARQRFHFQAKDRDAAKEVSLALHPPTIIEGRVLAADTGQPIADAVISIRGGFGRLNGGATTKFRADRRGRFKINPCAGDDFLLHVLPPEGQPYLPRETELIWPKGAVKKEIDFKLSRGLLIHGKVTEEGTGRPVPGASVQFFPMKAPNDLVYGIDTRVTSAADGSFQVAVPPGKGYLTVVGPTLDYIPREIGGGQLYGGGRPGGHRLYAHDIIAYDLATGEGPHELNATLKPGKTLRGRIVGPAGETVEDAVILSRQQIHPVNLSWDEYHFIHARDGRFELAGFDPGAAAPVYFLDVDHGWGARAELSGRQAGEELTIRLQPCGRAKARFVGPEGKPIAKLRVWLYFQILMTPGSRRLGFMDRGEPLAADGAFLPNADPKHHPTELATDADGRVTLAALIPGAPYRISDWSTVNVRDKGYQIRKDFTVKPGETLDLGDIPVEKP